MPITYALENGIATVTLDDGKANALSFAMSVAIAAALDRAATEARVVVLRGRPGVLCGGFDLKVIRAGDSAARTAMTEAGMALLARLYLLPQPMIIACTGHAVAAGGLMLLTADIRIGLQGDFRLGLNETAIGLSLPQLGLELARDRLIPGALTESTLRARLYAPEDAARVGYLDRTEPAQAFDAAVAQTAEELSRLDQTAYATTKQRLRQATLTRA